MPVFKPEENFVREYKFEPSKRPAAFYKTIGLHVLSVVSAIAFGFSYYQYLNGKFSIFAVLGFLVAYLVFSSLQVLLIKSLPSRTLIITLEVIGMCIFFVTTPPGILGAVIITLAALAVIGEVTARKKLSNSINPSYLKIARSKITRLVTALSLMVILLYAPRLDQNGNLISEGAFDKIFQQVVGVTNKLYPSVNLEESVTDFAQSLANQSLRKNEEFLEMDERNRNNSVLESAAKIITDLEQSLKIKINPEEKVIDLAYVVVTNKLSGLQESLKDQFRLGWLIILFFIIRMFGFFITIFSSLIVEGIIQIMISTNFIHVTGETRTKQSIKF